MKLTDRQIKNLKPKETRYEVFEGSGFGIRIAPSGKKSWVFLYHFEGRPRRMTFGQYPKVSVATAHEMHGKALADLEKGIDAGANKVEANEEDRLSPTIAALAAEYMEKWAKPRKRSWQEDQRLLDKDVIPVWGHRKAKSIKRREVVLLLDEIVKRGSPIVANRTLAVIRRMFNFAIERDILENTPCLKVKAPAKENQRDRVLSKEEIKKLWHGLENTTMSIFSKLALKLQLTTAQRKWELASAEWKEFDLENGYWEIPAEKAKNGNLHLVPLSKLAINLLQELKDACGDSIWLFPSPVEGQHMAGEAVDHALRKHIKRLEIDYFTPHDLRRTAASHMTAAGIPRLVVSKILNHVENSVTSVYDRHSYDKEKREALEIWGNSLMQLIKVKEYG